MTTLGTCIPANPDISGIGVRIAIYAQNLLSFVPAVWALWDRKVSEYELESVETQSTTILITAFAILIMAMAEAWSGLSNFHASIVLSLSWMNNTNTFTYFLLYVQRKSRPEEGGLMDLAAWIKHLRKKFLETPHVTSRDPDKQTPSFIKDEHGRRDKESEKSDGHKHKSPIRAILNKIVLVLGTFHLSLMASLGIWLWSNPGSFGISMPCSTGQPSTVLLGQPIALESNGLHAWSLVIYSLFLAPGLNLVLPLGLFLGLFLAYQAYHRQQGSDKSPPIYFHPSIVPTVVGLVLLLLINLIFLIDIELALRDNRRLQASGESAWTFGQILALLLLVLPLRDLAETISQRREQKHKEELARHDTEALRSSIRDEVQTDAILDLIKKGADVNIRANDGCNYATALQLASSRSDLASVTAILNFGADSNILGGKCTTALNAAIQAGHIENVKMLLVMRANPNIEGGPFGTALQGAMSLKRWDIVQVLLENGAAPKTSISRDVLCKAVDAWEIHVVDLLLHVGGDPNACSDNNRTLLCIAAERGNSGMVELLVDRGAKINAQDASGTPLAVAASRGHMQIVEILLNKGADVNAEGGMYGTALQTAVVHQ
ncbi:ankyrin repeat-containing domain protein [Mycena galericulata]|nr:ankyrin repeat-containing domain protein [Mycena galericulata]